LDRAIGIAQGLIGEIEKPFFLGQVWRHLQHDRDATADVRLSGAIDLVEQIDESLRHHFGQGFADGQTKQRRSPTSCR
jgi:hypothetical protein